MEQKYSTVKAMVAFIDVLGSTAAMREDVNESLNAIHIAYDATIEQFKKRNLEHLVEPKVNIFSDNIVLANEIIEGQEATAVCSIIFFCTLFQANMWVNGLIVRGGIACGSFFSDETMVWGNALVEAHELESKIAIYPRIIVEPEIAKLLKLLYKPDKLRLICEDFDGIFFVDPFGSRNAQECIELLDHLIEENTIRLKNCKNDLRVYQKVNWLQQYFCEKYDEIKEMLQGIE